MKEKILADFDGGEVARLDDFDAGLVKRLDAFDGTLAERLNTLDAELLSAMQEAERLAVFPPSSLNKARRVKGRRGAFSTFRLKRRGPVQRDGMPRV